MDTVDYKNYIVETLKVLVQNQDDANAALRQMQTDQKEIVNSLRQMQADIKHIDKKTDNILKYVEYLDSDLQKHKKAETV